MIGLVALGVPLFAGIRSNERKVNRLTIDGHSHGGGGWVVSSPTLWSLDGYLTYDASGKSPKVTFSQSRGPGTNWAFVGMKTFSERNAGRGFTRDSNLEQDGYTMELRATEGPYEGWYLGRVDGELVLVKQRRHSATVEMVVREADVIHK
jgi:hypothetical protein